MQNICNLPDDVLIVIALKLEPYDLILWRQVCRHWYHLGHSEIVISSTMSLKNPFIGDGQTWKDCFVIEQALTSIYPGVEKYLDLYHCLARATRRNHHPAIHYFLKRVTKDILTENEFATIIDLTTDPTILQLLLDKLRLCHPEVKHEQFIGDKKCNRRIKRAPLDERPYSERFLKECPWDTLQCGYKFALEGLKRKKIRTWEWTFSKEIRLLCRQLSQ